MRGIRTKTKREIQDDLLELMMVLRDTRMELAVLREEISGERKTPTDTANGSETT